MLRPASSLRPLLAVAILTLSLAPAALAQNSARTVSDTVPLAANGEVTVDNHEGSIRVTTWDRDQVKYEAEIMPTEEDPNAEKVTIRTRTSNDRLRLATEHEEADDESGIFGFSEDEFQWGGTNIPVVRYTIKMPRTSALRIDDHESTIDVNGLAGRLQIDTHEGTISVAEQRGEITIDSHESPISITDQEGDVTIDTHDGEITIEELDGGFRLESHDGSASVSFATFSDDVFAETHDGDVTLTLPAGAGFDLDTDFDDDAHLRSDFDLQSIRIEDEDDDEVNYRGDVNGGGPEIRFKSHAGDFSLRSR